MARQPRLSVPGYAHHVIVRGNNKQPIFKFGGDYERLLDLLLEASREYKVHIHAYVLMTNHLHLLATPQEADGLPKMMQKIGRTYVQVFNKLYQRTGTLFEGRYRSTLIQTERYLLACMAYIDLNPVRAGMVAHPQDYAWSSYAHYAGKRADKLVTPHPLVWQMGNTPYAREAAYVAMVEAGIAPEQQLVLTNALIKGWALGDEAFVADLQTRTQRRVAVARAGRPVTVSLPQ